MKSFYIKLLSIILISCLGIIVYSNTFHSPFQFDDYPSIIYNSFIRNISSLQNIWDFLPRRFILYLSFAVNYHFHQLDVFGYHLFNLAVHLIAAVLVWWLTLLTFSTPALKEEKIASHANVISLLVGLIFVAHPLQTEAVTYIVQRAASLAAMFYLASLCFYVKSRLISLSSPAKGEGFWGRAYYTGALIMAIAAMFTKEITITLPLMILLYEFYFLRIRKGFNWKHLIPFLCTLFIIPLTMLLTETGPARFQQLRSASGISSMHYLLTQLRVMVTYIRLVFLPINQNLDYDYAISKSIFELPALSGFLSLIIVLFCAQRLFLKYRLVSFSILWFFLTLLPESSILPIEDVIFEHRLYLPLAGYSMFLAGSVYYLLGKNNIKTMVIALVMIIVFNSILTYQRNKIWKDDFILWSDVIRKSPHKTRAYVFRGFAYYNRGEFTLAIADYSKAIKIDPKDAIAYNNRGNVYGEEHHFTQAVLDYDKAIEINPEYADTYIHRAGAYNVLKEYDKALVDVYKAEELGFVINPEIITRLKELSGRDR